MSKNTPGKYKIGSLRFSNDVPRDFFSGKPRKRARPNRQEQLAYDRIAYAQKFSAIVPTLNKELKREPRPSGKQIAFDSLDKQRESIAGRPKAIQCEVCESPDKIVWDHCHSSGKFRGWICHGCNIALGMVNDNPGTLRALAAYLDKFNSAKDTP